MHAQTRVGFSLVEVLVVLVLASLLMTTLVQGVSYLLYQFGRITAYQQRAEEVALRQQWFMSSVGGMLAYENEPRRFAGGTAGFSGWSAQPLAGDAGMPTPVRWTIQSFGTEVQLRYIEGEHDWLVERLEPSVWQFEYLGANGVWHTTWPSQASQQRWRTALPKLVRLVDVTEDRSHILAAFRVSQEAMPNFLSSEI